MAPIQWHSFFFLLFALLTCAFSVAVVVSGNIVRMACYLVASLAAVSGLFFLAGAEFLGVMQLMVYVGGTLVLLAFGVMLTTRGPFASMRTSVSQWVVAVIVGVALLAVLAHVVVQLSPSTSSTTVAQQMQPELKSSTTQLGLGLIGVRTDATRPADATGYLLVFEIISVHLLVVLVGAAFLARARRRVRGPEAE